MLGNHRTKCLTGGILHIMFDFWRVTTKRSLPISGFSGKFTQLSQFPSIPTHISSKINTNWLSMCLSSASFDTRSWVCPKKKLGNLNPYTHYMYMYISIYIYIYIVIFLHMFACFDRRTHRNLANLQQGPLWARVGIVLRCHGPNGYT